MTIFIFFSTQSFQSSQSIGFYVLVSGYILRTLLSLSSLFRFADPSQKRSSLDKIRLETNLEPRK